MRYVQRDHKTGKVVGHFANPQPYADEVVPDDHPDIVAFSRAKEYNGPSLGQQLEEIRSRLDKLESKT